MKKETLLEFPCEFPIKVMGKADNAFEKTALSIFTKHIPDIKENALTIRPSSNGTYVSITLTFTATSQKQLDDIYLELSAHPDVLMAL